MLASVSSDPDRVQPSTPSRMASPAPHLGLMVLVEDLAARGGGNGVDGDRAEDPDPGRGQRRGCRTADGESEHCVDAACIGWAAQNMAVAVMLSRKRTLRRPSSR